jgi:hypothetical protein
VFRDEVAPNQRWLFLNKEGKGHSDKAYVDLVGMGTMFPTFNNVILQVKARVHSDSRYGPRTYAI